MSRRVRERDEVRARARGRCEYCQSSELICGQAFEIEHVIPLVAGGRHEVSNLALACRPGNAYKGCTTSAYDAESSVSARIFNPRSDAWDDHFAWDATGAHVIAQTAIGRVSVATLRLNEALRVAARLIWAAAGWHPPAQS